MEENISPKETKPDKNDQKNAEWLKKKLFNLIIKYSKQNKIESFFIKWKFLTKNSIDLKSYDSNYSTNYNTNDNYISNYASEKNDSINELIINPELKPPDHKQQEPKILNPKISKLFKKIIERNDVYNIKEMYFIRWKSSFQRKRVYSIKNKETTRQRVVLTRKSVHAKSKEEFEKTGIPPEMKGKKVVVKKINIKKIKLLIIKMDERNIKYTYFIKWRNIALDSSDTKIELKRKQLFTKLLKKCIERNDRKLYYFIKWKKLFVRNRRMSTSFKVKKTEIQKIKLKSRSRANTATKIEDKKEVTEKEKDNTEDIEDQEITKKETKKSKFASQTIDNINKEKESIDQKYKID